MKTITGAAMAVAILVVAASAETNRIDKTVIKATVSRVDVVEPHPQIVITNSTELSKLIFFFGDTPNEKDTDLAGAWEAKFQITFEMSDGVPVNVATSHDDQDWSSGKGDKALKLGLAHFLEPLFKKK